MKKINVNTDACIGCGACVAIDSEHFDFDENGYSEVISNDNLETSDLSNAISSCPTNAISIIEDERSHDCGCENNNDGCNCENCTCNCNN